MKVFSTQIRATKTVARVRLRSTIEPPPSELPPPPTPKAPERPASFPECSRIRKIRTTEKSTCRTLRNVYMAASLALRDFFPRLARPVAVLDPVEDLHRLLAEFGVEQGEVLVGELAGGVVELGIADLAVLGFLEGVELGADEGAATTAARGPERDQRAGEGDEAADPHPGD